MPNQLPLVFTKNTIKQINIYREAGHSESIGEAGFNVKFTATQKEALKNILREHNMNASTFIREAMDFYIDLFPYRQKLAAHRRLVRALLDKLS